jgi:ankyrin repeat protein
MLTFKITFLLSKNATINITDERNRTALHYCAKDGSVESMTNLLAHIHRHCPTGDALAFMKAKDAKGKTALMYAVPWHEKRCNQNLRNLLQQPGIDIHAQNRQQKNALHSAVENLNAKGVKLLLNAGATIDSSLFVQLITESLSFDHRIRAIQHHTQIINKIITFFVNKGTNINTTNEDGDTLLITAIKNYENDIVQHLIHLGANIHCTTLHGKMPLQIAQENYTLATQTYKELQDTLPTKYTLFADKDFLIEQDLLTQKNKIDHAREIVSMLAPKETT